MDVDMQGSDMAHSCINGGVAKGVVCAELEIKAVRDACTGEINALCTYMLTKATARYHTQGHHTHMQIPISCWLGAKLTCFCNLQALR